MSAADRLRIPVPTAADAGLHRVWRRSATRWDVYITYRFGGAAFLGHGRVDPPKSEDRDEIRDAEARADAAALREIADQIGRHNHRVRP